MQSIEYSINNYSPAEQTCIENIQSKNTSSFWKSSSDSATISMNFDSCKVLKIEFCTNLPCSYQITSKVSNQGITLDEGKSNQNINQKIFKIINVECPHNLTNIEFKLSTLDDEILQIFYIFLFGPREGEGEEKIKVNQPSLGILNFYSKNRGSKSLSNKPTYSAKSSIQSNPKINTNQTFKKKTYEKSSKYPENIESPEEQKKIYENIQKNRQKTIQTFTRNQHTNSYANLMSTKVGLTVCCLDEPIVKQIIEEICQVVGICYFSDLEPGVSFIIYSGDDRRVFQKAEKLGIKVVSKDWLFQSIDKRQALEPTHFIQIFNRFS